MVQKELDKLEHLLKLYPNATIAGHSLGGWWASNLALRPEVQIKKMVLWTPLGNAEDYPIFNVSPRYHPPNQPITNTHGPHRVLVYSAKDDLIVPPPRHGWRLISHFNAMNYVLQGGHLYQSNHRAALEYMKDWIEVY
jgi:pimeloyl-ACP methyl ester carboxylesterase